MSDSKSPSLHKVGGSSLARERLIWATRPMGFLLLVLWVLHPATFNHGDPVRMALLGFLVGICYGLVVYGSTLRGYLVMSDQGQRYRPNRVPEEYYWGNVSQVMYDNR